MVCNWSAITGYYYVLVDWVNPARFAILNKIELDLVIARIMFWCNTQRTDTDNFILLALYPPFNMVSAGFSKSNLRPF